MICCIIPVLDISLQEPRFFFFFFSHLLFLQLPFLCRWRDLPCRATMQVTYTAERSKQNLWETASQHQPPCLAMTWTESGLSTRNIICCIIPLLDVSLQECPLLFLFFFFFHLLFLPLLCRWCHLPCRATVQVTVQTCTVESSKQNLWQTASWHLAASCFHL